MKNLIKIIILFFITVFFQSCYTYNKYWAYYGTGINDSSTPDLTLRKVDYKNKIEENKYLEKYIDYEIRNSIQTNLMLSKILQQYENKYKNILPFKSTSKMKRKINYIQDYQTLLNYMPPIGFQLDITYTPIQLKYSINGIPLIFYKITVKTYWYNEVYWKKYIQDTTLKHYYDVKKEFRNLKHYYDVKYKDTVDENSYLIAILPHLKTGPVTGGFNARNVDIMYFSKDFYSYYNSKSILDGMLYQTLYVYKDVYVTKQENWCKYCDNFNLNIIKRIKYCKPYPFHGNPKELIPYIYILSWSEYEPEDVFYEKRIGYQFYYTFYSNKYKKNYHVHYNARSGEFVKYTEIEK